MKEEPDIARLGALIGDPARANMLTALMSGQALTASELASVAGITVQTASAHLTKLEAGGLLARRQQGRHRYFRLADENVAALLERMMGIAAEKGHARVRTGPKDPAMRRARVCYNHLAGERAVQMCDSLRARNFLIECETTLELSAPGAAFMTELGIDVAALTNARRPLCKPCLDWSARRTHLAGGLGTALLDRFYALGWARREKGSRVVQFSRSGDAEFLKLFLLEPT